jgi:hypothetical protein
VGVQDVAAAVALDDRDEGPGELQRAEEVRVEDRADVLERGVEVALRGTRAGVVDQHRHVRRGRRERVDRGLVGDLERQRYDARVTARLRLAGGRVDLGRAAREQFVDDRPADAALAAGDQDDSAFECGHGELLG